MVASLKGSLKQTFNAMGAGSDEELQADVRNSFGIWTVDPIQVIANEIKREQKEELIAGEAEASLPVEQRDRNERANEETVVEKVYMQPEPQLVEQGKDHEDSQLRHRLELDRGDGAQAVGLMSTNAQLDEKHLSQQEKEKKERQFSNLLYRLYEQQKWLRQRISDMQIIIDDLNKQIDNHSRKIESIDKFSQDLRDGKVELDEDGYPLDQNYKTLVKEYEQKFRKKFDADASDVVTNLQLMKAQESKAADIKVIERDKTVEEQGSYIDMLNETENNIETLENGGDIDEKYAAAMIQEISSIQAEMELIKNKPIQAQEQSNQIIDMGFDTPTM